MPSGKPPTPQSSQPENYINNALAPEDQKTWRPEDQEFRNGAVYSKHHTRALDGQGHPDNRFVDPLQ